MFFNNLAPGNGHVNIHHMDKKVSNLRLHHRWFLYSIHSFVFKQILHIIILKIIYDLMSCVTTFTTDMTRIPHRFLYFDMLINNLRNCRSKVFLSFDFIGFNIMICPMTICIIHSCFLCNCLSFLS
jgi:hypothetical protein